MPGLIPLIKEVTPLRPVIYRSHIQMRSDLIADPTTPQAEAWNYFWDSIKCADLFISHPVASFVPHMVPPETVGYLPASTDWWVIYIFIFSLPFSLSFFDFPSLPPPPFLVFCNICCLPCLRFLSWDGCMSHRLDGLNKPMDDFDVGYYGRIFNAKCREIGMTTIDFPDGMARSREPSGKKIK